MNAIIRWYLLGLSVYHLWTGAISYFSPGFALKFYRRFYDCNPVEQRHLRIVLRPWGALAVFAGVAGLAAFQNPAQHRAILAALAVLLAMRIGFRIGLRRELGEISGIAPRRNWLSILCLLIGVLLLGAGAWVNWETSP